MTTLYEAPEMFLPQHRLFNAEVLFKVTVVSLTLLAITLVVAIAELL